jgi:hypothetical protein
MNADNDRDREYLNRNTSLFLVLALTASQKLPQLRQHRMHRPATDRAVLAALWAYRHWFTRHTPKCAQNPSCSTYAVTAVTEYGWRKGIALTLKRMGPCL